MASRRPSLFSRIPKPLLIGVPLLVAIVIAAKIPVSAPDGPSPIVDRPPPDDVLPGNWYPYRWYRGGVETPSEAIWSKLNFYSSKNVSAYKLDGSFDTLFDYTLNGDKIRLVITLPDRTQSTVFTGNWSTKRGMLVLNLWVGNPHEAQKTEKNCLRIEALRHE